MSDPVEDRKFARPLIKALRGHVDALATSMAGPNAPYRALESVRPCAVAWVYLSTLTAWAEDHALIDPWLRKDAADLRQAYLDAGAGTVRDWLGVAFTSLAVHPATECLLDPRYSDLLAHEPGEDVCRDLVDWWRAEAPPLTYDVEVGPASITGWLPGDILQHLRDSRPDGGGGGNAQTPWWIADGILDLTLVPAAAEFRGETLKTIDPTCGTGHFLVRKIDYLWEWYTTGNLEARQMKVPSVSGGAVLEPVEAIKRIIAGVDGCEIHPLTAAVARLRFVVAIGELMHRSGLLPVLRLDGIPPFQPRIAVGDSLLAGKVTAAEYAQIHPKLAEIQNLGISETAPLEEPSQSALFEIEGAA